MIIAIFKDAAGETVHKYFSMAFAGADKGAALGYAIQDLNEDNPAAREKWTSLDLRYGRDGKETIMRDSDDVLALNI